jgi:hypothetical protein
MKQNRWLLPLVLFFLAALSGCGSDDGDGPAPQSQGNKTLAMKIDGADWIAAKNVAAAISFHSTDGKTDAAIISGADNSNQSIQITTAREIEGPGTYQIPSATGGGIALAFGGKTYIAKNFTVIIDEIKTVNSSKFVRGTFSGVVRDLHDESAELEITEGEFDGIGN